MLTIIGTNNFEKRLMRVCLLYHHIKHNKKDLNSSYLKRATSLIPNFLGFFLQGYFPLKLISDFKEDDPLDFTIHVQQY